MDVDAPTIVTPGTAVAPATAVTPPDPQSKRSRKKLEKQASKKQGKLQHRTRMHDSMLENARRLRDAFQRGSFAIADEVLYPQLPRAGEDELFASIDEAAIQRSTLFRAPSNSWRSAAADGDESAAEQDDSPRARSSRVVDRFLWRPHKYNEKYACQELSLLYQLYRLGGDECDLVLDVGGGNANLSCLIAVVLDVPVVCVEMESPREELRGEAWLPPEFKRKGAVTRVEALVQDYELPEGFSNVLVLGKHLCGPGTDAAIEFARKNLVSTFAGGPAHSRHTHMPSSTSAPPRLTPRAPCSDACARLCLRDVLLLQACGRCVRQHDALRGPLLWGGGRGVLELRRGVRGGVRGG